MTLFTRSLWPDEVQAPYRRLVTALVVSPFLVGLLLSTAAFLIAGTTEPTRADALAVTLDSAASIMVLLFLFTFTFGVFGVGVLWAFAQRGVVVWVLTGGLLGALAGLLFGIVFMDAPGRTVLLAFAVVGWMLFLLIRKIGGIRHPPRQRAGRPVP